MLKTILKKRSLLETGPGKYLMSLIFRNLTLNELSNECKISASWGKNYNPNRTLYTKN